MANGTRTLAEALAHRLNVHAGSQVELVEEREGGVVVTWRQNGEQYSEFFDGCIVAVPPDLALQLVPAAQGAVRDFFRNVRPVRHITVHLGLSKQLDIEESLIFGSEKESPDILGIVIDPNRAKDRACQGNAVVSIWMTIEWSANYWDLPDSEVLSGVLGKVLPILGNLVSSINVSVIKRRDYSCYQGYPGYYRHLEHYMNSPHSSGAIRYAGDFAAIGIEGAVISGYMAAESILASG